ncbi:DUF4876 domain-containing protein [Epilithonimonas sp. JDS]|uniref:DUF4876 domain-containing protein n=1 Tax=Epilithonimonas sp. JDS TaxID=2902797 RepID=UPI001E2A89E5|nr:DUF4876 domain-containing protein [Epilithonimonas sp. JDS]MCD9856685.1 DUF4876 domain-containing protein [Epilithonimonas sp. JDS]
MKKRFLAIGFMAVLASTTLIVSCSGDDDDFGTEVSNKSVLTVTLAGDNIATFKTIELEILETNSGAITKKTLENASAYSFELPYGSYKIVANGTVVTKDNEEVQVGATAQKDVNTGVVNLSLPLIIKQFNKDFIIEEVFFAGVKTNDGKNYNNSRYFKITNNTNDVLYADRLMIATSEFFTTVARTVTPNIVDQAFPISAVMIVPGTGKEHPVQPGSFIVVADNAIDHTASNGFNLTNADFEFPSTNPSLGQVDNPSVPNMNIAYTQMTFNMIFLYTTSQQGYALARLPEGQTSETFLAQNKYDYSYTNSAGGVTNRSVYKIPNTWIVDALNTTRENDFLQIVTTPSIDAGWTTASPGYNGKTVRRKILGTMSNGKNLYKDTNNSTLDFVRNSEPSLKNGIVK